MVIAMRVVPYEPSHIDELRAVCIEQASERARTEEAYGQFTLWMYCDPYLENGIAYMLLDDEGVARGYTLAAEDAHEWRKSFEPYRERIAQLVLAKHEKIDWEEVEEGAQAASELRRDFGFTVKMMYYNRFSAETFVKVMNDCIKQQPDGVIIVPSRLETGLPMFLQFMPLAEKMMYPLPFWSISACCTPRTQ